MASTLLVSSRQAFSLAAGRLASSPSVLQKDIAFAQTHTSRALSSSHQCLGSESAPWRQRMLGWGVSRSPRKQGRVFASAEELPNELEEDEGKFAKITDEDPAFGPPALLLLGYELHEVPKVHEMLEAMGGDFMKVLLCTEKMLGGTLGEAVNQVQDKLPSKVADLPNKMAFMSGLTGEELMMLVDAFSSTGLEEPVFAAMVPKNEHKPLTELMSEVMGDHTRLVVEKAAEMQAALNSLPKDSAVVDNVSQS